MVYFIAIHNLGLVTMADLHGSTQPWTFVPFLPTTLADKICSFLHKNGLSTIVYRIFKFLHKPMSMIADSMQTLNVGINTVDVHE